MIDSKIEAWIKNCEGLKLEPYLDTTGHLTIGYGRNLSERGISASEAERLFQNDIAMTIQDLENQEWYLSLPLQIKYALINMCFNLGISSLLEFVDMIAALKAKEYTKAAHAVLDSHWADQVGQRAKDVAVMIRQYDVTAA